MDASRSLNREGAECFGERIFEVKYFEYTLFGGVVLNRKAVGGYRWAGWGKATTTKDTKSHEGRWCPIFGSGLHHSRIGKGIILKALGERES